MLKFRRVGAAKVLLAVLIFVMAAFILLSFSKEKFDARALLFMALTMLLIMVQHMLLCFILPNGDRLTGVLVGFLMGIGLVMQYRLNADTALRQLIFSCFGLAAMVIMLMLMKKPIVLMYLRIPAAIISLGILGALMFVGKESGGAVNWISIGGILFQPSEFVKIAMIIVLAGGDERADKLAGADSAYAVCRGRMRAACASAGPWRGHAYGNGIYAHVLCRHV